MDDVSTGTLFSLLAILIILSGFFSGSETALTALNRYKSQHLARNGHKGAQRALRLLERQDRLIGVILLGNNFVNILASAIATVLGLRFYGEAGLAIATGLLTFVILIFAEVTPKTLGALHPEKVAYKASIVYGPLQVVLYPILLVVTGLARLLLRLLGVRPEEADQHSLSTEELRTVVAETRAMLPRRHQAMLLQLLDLEKATVEDIMIPRNEIQGVDISEDWPECLHRIRESQHTRLPLFDGSIDDLRGIIHVRRLLPLLAEGQLDRENLLAQAREPYFIPEGTALNQQLLNFQTQRRRIGFVVDEYGDIQGLVTLEDILEEIVGEFTTDPATRNRRVQVQADGTYRVDAKTSVRYLNRSMKWSLPASSARTLNGLILNHLENFPEPGSRLKLGDYLIEVETVAAHLIESVRITAPAKSAERIRPRSAGA
ncbi:MAG: HlyC/CorC family transporter [Oceanococcaceae bacterium]